MDSELLEQVRNLKREGMNDVDITNRLSGTYEAVDIARQLESLKYMRPELEAEDNEAPVRNNQNRHKTAIVGSLIFFV